MNDYEQKVKTCHIAMECAVGEPLTAETLELRYRLLNEELSELKTEMDTLCQELKIQGKAQTETKARMLKELSDLQYVLSGMAVSFGIRRENRLPMLARTVLGSNGSAQGRMRIKSSTPSPRAVRMMVPTFPQSPG